MVDPLSMCVLMKYGSLVFQWLRYDNKGFPYQRKGFSCFGCSKNHERAKYGSQYTHWLLAAGTIGTRS